MCGTTINAAERNAAERIQSGRTTLGIEFGSTRIKAVLLDGQYKTLASGSYQWENQFKDGLWTYSLDTVREGLQESYRRLAQEVQAKYGVTLTTVGAIGVSAMMHGYLAFDRQGELLVPFRTWRNTNTQQAADILTEALQYNIPLRWSVAHLYQAVLNKEPHVKQLASITTLAGYIHWQLTGQMVLGVGDASGMFPVEAQTGQFDCRRLEQFQQLVEAEHLPWRLEELLPQILLAGDLAGSLTEAGARFIDPSGQLRPGIPLCPPEGDAGTGMVATNSVGRRTGNVSAGTSIFAMLVLERELLRPHREIDLVTTPAGELVAMVHCNNCTSDINAWAGVFAEFARSMGIEADQNQLYTVLFQAALQGDEDCGGLMGYNYDSGEPVTGFAQGRPLMMRSAQSTFTFANFMRMQLYTAIGALKSGLDILLQEEQVQVTQMFGHGGFFKTSAAGQTIMSAAMNAPVTVMETAGEGGAWGIAVLADYLLYRKEMKQEPKQELKQEPKRELKQESKRQPSLSLEQYLREIVFAGQPGTTIQAERADVEGFQRFMERYRECLPVERAAVEYMK